MDVRNMMFGLVRPGHALSAVSRRATRIFVLQIAVILIASGLGFDGYPVAARAERTFDRYDEPKSDEKREDEKKDEPKPADAAATQPTQVPGQPVQIDPETQKKIDDLMAKEAGKKSEDDKKPAEPSAGNARSRTRGGKTTRPNTPPGAPGVGADPNAAVGDAGPVATINIPAEEPGATTKAEDRKYKFSIKDASYEQLIEGIAHQTGLGVLGEAPKDGRVSFVTDEELSFDDMMDRVRTLLFNYKPLDPYTILRRPSGLEVIRVNDYPRNMPEDRMFRSVDLFRVAALPASELALVVYTPKSGSISDLKQVRDFMPDYFRVTPLERPENAVALYGRVTDIDKYLRLIDFFGTEGQDPRTMEKIIVEHILPSDAVAKLSSFMDLTGQTRAAPAPRGRGAEPSPLDSMPPPPITVFPDDTQGVIIVRAMQDKIAEIKFLLPYIDVSTGAEYEPVIIPIEHADPNVLLPTIQQILAVSSPSASTAAPPPTPPAAGGGKRKRAPRPAASPVSTDSLTLLVHPANIGLIAIGAEEEVAHVRQLVAQFDVPDIVPFTRIPLKHRTAVDMATTLDNMINAGGNAAKAGAAAMAATRFIAEASGEAIWFIGPPKTLEQTRELLAVLDVPEDEPQLHIVKIQYQKASFVAAMLREYEGASSASVPAPAQPERPRGKRRSSAAATAVSKFTTDDEHNALYVLATDGEWSVYEPLIKRIDSPIAEGTVFQRLPVSHLGVDDAIEQLKNIIGEEGAAGAIQFVPAGDTILVFNANDADVARMKTILTEIDKPLDLEQRTFEIKHADPAAIMALIEKLVGGESSAPAPKRRTARRPGPAGEPTPSSVTAGDAMTIVQIDQRLVVRATPALMTEIAAIVDEFDRPGGKPEIRVFEDFSPMADIGAIADTLESVLGGGAPARPSRGGPKEEGLSTTAGPRFIPQSASHRLVVIAQPSLFPEIEQLLNVLRRDDEIEIPDVAFIDLQHADAERLVEQIEPILELRVRRLIEKGEIVQAPDDEGAPRENLSSAKGARRTRAASTGTTSRGQRYHLAPASGNRRIVVVAVPKVIEEVRQLVAKFDTPGGDAPVFRTVDLMHASAMEVARAVRDLMGSAPRVVQTKDGGKEAPATSRIRSAEESLSIVEQPGGNGLVLYGPLADVEQAIKWIEELDARAAAGKAIKVYQIRKADVEKLVDLIMNVADAPTPATAGGPKKGVKAAAGRAGKILDVLEEDSTEFTTNITRMGQELYIQADLIANTMLVAAHPSKIAQVDAIVAQFDPEEGETPIEETAPVPKLIYELKYADGYDASFSLEAVLKVYWEPADKLPDVDYESLGDTEVLIVKYPERERFHEIEDLIAKFADKPKEEDIKSTRKGRQAPPGMSARDAAAWLKQNHPELDIQLIDVSEAVQEDYGIERVGPAKPRDDEPKTGDSKPVAANGCVLPLSLQRAVTAAILAPFADPKDDEIPPDDEAGDEEGAPNEPPPFDPQGDNIRRAARRALGMEPPGDASKPANGENSGSEDERTGRRPDAKPLKVYFDETKGILMLEGQAIDVEDAEDFLKDLEKELEETGALKPDIRAFRVRYIDLQLAADIIDEMFNASRQQRAQADAMQRAMIQQQQQMARQAAAQAAQQQRAGGDQQGQGGRGQQQGRNAQAQQQVPQMQMPQMPQTTVRVYPNFRDRTLIIRAETSQFSGILELLATIDQPQPIDSKLRVFALEKLNATEVESMLRDMLGLDAARGGAQRSGRQQPTRGGAGGQPDGGGVATPVGPGPGGQLPSQIMQETTAGQLGIDTSHIRLSSNAEANTVMVMAPQEAIDFIGNLIEELESQEGPARETRHFRLQFADPEEVGEFLSTHFEAKSAVGRSRRAERGGAGGGASAALGRSINSPTIVPYARLRMLSVQATEEQMVEVEKLISELDVPSAQEELRSVTLQYADAKQVADTLSAMFGGGATGGRGPGRGAQPATGETKFIGEEGGSTVFYMAPESLNGRIVEAIGKLDAEYQDKVKPRTITLVNAKPSVVAEAIESAYGSGRSQPGRGGAAGKGARSRFTVSAHDPSKRLFVVADDAMFAEIESLAKTLDKSTEVTIDFKVYPLQHASAKKVHTVMDKMIRDYLARLGPAGKDAIDPFSVEVDEKANALIVLGGPVVFGFVEKSLQTVDVPGAEGDLPGELSMSLTNSDATEVAQTLKAMWQGKQLAAGEVPPTIEANKSGNMILAKGTRKQIEEIRKTIESIEAAAQPKLVQEVIKLQYAQAEEVAATINRVFEDQFAKQQAVGRLNSIPAHERTVVVTPDANTQQLIVQASPANMTRIKERVAELDKKDVAVGTVNKVYTIRRADPNTVANIVKEWGRTRTQGASGQNRAVALRDQVQAFAENSTQSVVVTASEANHKLIKELIDSMDVDDPSRRLVEVITLKNAEGAAVARALQEIYVRSSPQRGGEPPISVSEVQGARAVLVKASAADMERIKSTVTELDTDALGGGAEVRVVALKNADATEIQTAVQNYLSKPGQGGGRGPGAELLGGIRVSVLAQSNSIVLSGDKAAVDNLETKVVEMDNQAGEQGVKPVFIALKQSRVSQIMPTLEQMYLQQRPGAGRQGSQPPIIVANDALNGFLVQASARDLTAIRATVEQLDNEQTTAYKPFKIVQVAAGVNVTQLAEQVEESVNESVRALSSGSGGPGGRRETASVTLTADRRTNSIIIAGSAQLFDQAEQMIKMLEGMGPTGGMTTAVYRPQNTKAEDLQRLIDELKRRAAGEETSRSGGSRPTQGRRR